jgi:uncharacterized membrane protein YbhN (UPF0104 family)
VPGHTARRWLLRAAAALVGAALLWSVLAQVDWQQFGQLWQRLTLPGAVLAATAYTAQNGFRALRFRALLARHDITLPSLFAVTLYHNGMVRLLPLKLGEAVYPVLMRQRYGVPFAAGISSLFAARLLELQVILMVVTLGFFGLGTAADVTTWAALCAGLLVSVAALYNSGRMVGWVLGALWGAQPPGALARLANELDTLRLPGRFAAAFFWSFFTYGSSFAANALLLAALGVALPPGALVAIISLGMFATAFPFNISGFGMVEWSLSVGLVYLAGLGTGEAAALALFVNGFQQVCAFVSGFMGWLALHARPAPIQRLES